MDGITRRGLMKAGGASAAGLTLLGAAGCSDDDSARAERTRAQAPPNAANVVVVVVDSLRTDHVYGRRAITKSWDKFAEQSLRFTEVRPEAMPTIPARRSIMMGHQLFPFRGWRPYKGLTPSPGWEPIGHDGKMWIEQLRDQGWTIGYVTDNPHILAPVHKDFRSKFDRFDTIAGQVPLQKAPKRKVSQAELYKHLPPVLRGSPAEPRMRAYLAANPPGRSEDEYLAARVFKAGIDWLDYGAAKQPFALVVDNFDAHEPWDVPASLKALYGPARIAGVEPIQPFNTPAGGVEQLGLSRSMLARMRDLYAAEVTMADRGFGRLMDKLAALGLEQNTVVVFVSDHGVLLGEFGYVGKKYSVLHDELTRVPLMIRDPHGRAAGRASKYFASTHDIGATVLAMLGVEKLDSMDGHDLSPLFDGRRPAEKRDFYVSGYTDYVLAGDGRWHLIADNQGGDRSLYDRRSDPGLRRDVAARHPQQADRLWKAVKQRAGGQPPKFDL